MTESKKTKPSVDWELIEKHYRAGLLSLREICAAVENTVTEGAIRKRAKRDGWTRNLAAKIQQRADDLVRKEAVRTTSTQLTPADERTVIEVNAQKVADVDMAGRADLLLVLETQRTLAREVASLTNPEFMADLVKLGELLDKSGPNASGTWVKDKLNETYMYIISLAGRIKMMKDLASAHGVYIPMQRKIFGLDAEKQQASELDAVLKKLSQERGAA